MVTFIRKYCSKIDDKGRMVFPAPFKGLLSAGDDMRFVVKKSIYDNCLEMFTFEEWSRQSGKIKDSLDFFNPDHNLFWREYLRDCVIVEPDAKYGRISISRELLDAVSIDREVVFFGVDFKIEIWAKEAFESSSISNENYIAIARSLARK